MDILSTALCVGYITAQHPWKLFNTCCRRLLLDLQSCRPAMDRVHLRVGLYSLIVLATLVYRASTANDPNSPALNISKLFVNSFFLL